MSRKAPDFKLRLGELKPKWVHEMEKDGFKGLATWVKVIVNQYISGELVRRDKE